MKRIVVGILFMTLVTGLSACATAPQGRYNTQRGAAIGAGVGAIGGQIIGGTTEGTLIGAAVGTLLGAIVGNAVDQEQQAGLEAAATNKRVVYYDNQGGAVEAIPGPMDQYTDCRKVTKRVWKNGILESETIEEICEGEKRTTDY